METCICIRLSTQTTLRTCRSDGYHVPQPPARSCLNLSPLSSIWRSDHVAGVVESVMSGMGRNRLLGISSHLLCTRSSQEQTCLPSSSHKVIIVTSVSLTWLFCTSTLSVGVILGDMLRREGRENRLLFCRIWQPNMSPLVLETLGDSSSRICPLVAGDLSQVLSKN